jgi:hypothetical protein
MYDNIICPYCFMHIGINNVVFRMKSGVEKTDEYLNNYQKNKGNDVYEKLNFSYVDSAFVSEQEKKYIKPNMLVSINDNKGVKLDERLCPYCHNTLHVNFGKNSIYPISVLGFTSAGKTTFLAALHKQVNSSQIIAKVNIGENKTIDDNIRLFEDIENKGLPQIQTSTVSYLGPFIYDASIRFPNEKNSLSLSEKNATFIFYDLPGEKFANSNEIKMNAGYIDKSSGWIFLIDPENLKGIATVFESVYKSFLAQGIGNNAKIALVINKSDLLSSIVKLPQYFVPNSIRSYKNGEPIDLKTIRRNNDDIVSTIVSQVDELKSINNQVSSFCKGQDFCWFISSCVNGGVFNPINCDEPFYWIMSKLGLYPHNTEN